MGGVAPLKRELFAVLCACAFLFFVRIPARNELVQQGVALALRRFKEMNLCNFLREGPALTLERAFSAFFPGRPCRPLYSVMRVSDSRNAPFSIERTEVRRFT